MHLSARKLSAAALVALALAAGAAAGPAAAGPKPRIDVRGQGTYALSATGAAEIAGSATGTVEGPYTATLTAADGTLPEPGVCEPATGTIRITGARGEVLALEGDGQACGKWLQPPTSLVTHVFTGRYRVTEAPKKALTRTDGFFELRLGTNDVASMFAIDT